MLRISLQSHSTICIFTRSHKKMWVSYVNGTPTMSQIGSLIYGISQLQKYITKKIYVCSKYEANNVIYEVSDLHFNCIWKMHQLALHVYCMHR